MAARLPSGRVSRDWWQRRPPKDETRRIVFKLRRACWVLMNRWYRDLVNTLPVEKIPPDSLEALRAIRRQFTLLTLFVDQAIAEYERPAQVAAPANVIDLLEAKLARRRDRPGKERA